MGPFQAAYAAATRADEEAVKLRERRIREVFALVNVEAEFFAGISWQVDLYQADEWIVGFFKGQGHREIAVHVFAEDAGFLVDVWPDTSRSFRTPSIEVLVPGVAQLLNALDARYTSEGPTEEAH